MSGFRIWFEEQAQKDEKLKQVWRDFFDAIKVGGIAKSDIVTYSLEKATEGLGKQAPAGTLIMNLLKPIFDRLQQLDSAYFREKVEDVTQWLGQSQGGDAASTAPKRTIGGLLERLFGTELYHKFYSSDPKSSDEPEAEPIKAPAQPPTDGAGGQNQPPMQPDQPPPPSPDPSMQGQQPQMPDPGQKPAPGQPGQPPMPQPPPGFNMGMF